MKKPFSVLFIVASMLMAIMSLAANAATFTATLPLVPDVIIKPLGETFSVTLPEGNLNLPALPENEFYGPQTFEYHWHVSSGGQSGNGRTASISSSSNGGQGAITSPGCYTLTFTGKASYTICKIEDGVEHTDGPYEVTLTASEGGRLAITFWLVAVDRIEITGNGASGTVSDRTSNLLRGTKYNFKAYPSPANAPGWPAGYPTWSSSGIGRTATGDECIGTFYADGDGKTLTASCGSNSKTATFNSVTPQIQRVEFSWGAGNTTQGINIYDKKDKWQASIGGLTAVNHPACYIQGQKGKVRVKFYASKNLTFPVTVAIRGDVHWFDEYITGEDYGRDTMTFGTDWSNTGEIESEANAESRVKDDYDVDISWRYKVGASGGSNEWIDTGDTDNLRYYLVWENPSCDDIFVQDCFISESCYYAEDNNSYDSIREAILDGIEQNYIYNGNCDELSSRLVILVLVQGINAKLHRWACNVTEELDPSFQIEENSMLEQKTIPLKPIQRPPQAELYFSFHQWVESGGKQYDPMDHFIFNGTWGEYEDYLFLQYLRYIDDISIPVWEDNQPNQNTGCEVNGIHTIGEINNWNGLVILFF